VPTTKLTLFVVNKDERYTKEGCSKSMKNALYVQRYGKKAPLGLKWCRTAKKIKPVALATCYQPVWIEKYLKSSCVIKVASMKRKFFHYEEEVITCNHWINTFRCQQKMNGGHWRMNCMYSGMLKGSLWSWTTSNSEKKIKPVALPIVGLKASGRQLVSQ